MAKMLHACIRVKDLEKSLQFYTEVIGLIETRRYDYLDRGFMLVYLSDCPGGYEIELTYNVDSRGYEIGNGFSHFAIGVDNFEETYQAHKKAGYEVTEPKSLNGDKPTLYFVTDPDGYKVEIIRTK